MEPIEPCQVVERFVAAINEHDVTAICHLLTEDHILIDSGGQKVITWYVVRDAWAAYFDMMPDYHITVEQVLQDHNVVGLFGRASGTCALNGQPRADNRWEIPAAWRAVVRGS